MFGNYYSTLAENLAKMFSQLLNKCYIKIVIKYYERIILSDYFDLVSVLKYEHCCEELRMLNG